MFRKVHIKQHEAGLVFWQGEFRELLGPGEYRFWNRKQCIEIVSKLKTRFDHPEADSFLDHPSIAEHLHVLVLGDDERALIWKADRLEDFIGPGRHAFWKTPADLTIEKRNISEFQMEHPRLNTIIRNKNAALWLTIARVYSHEVGVLHCNGKLVACLEPGEHAFWDGVGKLDFQSVDKREQVLDIAGQEIMTSDKVTLRVNLLVVYETSDVQLAGYQGGKLRDCVVPCRPVGTKGCDRDDYPGQLAFG